MMTSTNSTNSTNRVSIPSGTILDHLGYWQAPSLLEVLRLQTIGKLVVVLLGQESSSMKKKDMIFIEDWEPDEQTKLKVSLLTPYATLNLLRDGKIYKKFKPELPDILEGAVPCPNSRCITHAEEVPHKILTHVGGKQMPYQCYYCEHRFSVDQVKFL